MNANESGATSGAHMLVEGGEYTRDARAGRAGERDPAPANAMRTLSHLETSKERLPSRPRYAEAVLEPIGIA